MAESPLEWLDTRQALMAAIEKAQLDEPTQDNTGEVDLPTEEAFKVLGRCSTAAFDRMTAGYDDHPSLWLRADGLLLMEDASDIVHERSSMSWNRLVGEAANLGGLSSSLIFGGTTGYMIGNLRKQPDAQVHPYGRERLFTPTTNPFPTLVLEIDYGYGSVRAIREKLDLWLSRYTNVNLFFGLKIYKYSTRYGGRRMVLIYGERKAAIEHQVYEVGDYASRGVALHCPDQLQIPVYLLLDEAKEEPGQRFMHFDLHKWISEVKRFCISKEGH